MNWFDPCQPAVTNAAWTWSKHLKCDLNALSWHPRGHKPCGTWRNTNRGIKSVPVSPDKNTHTHFVYYQRTRINHFMLGLEDKPLKYDIPSHLYGVCTQQHICLFVHRKRSFILKEHLCSPAMSSWWTVFLKQAQDVSNSNWCVTVTSLWIHPLPS